MLIPTTVLTSSGGGDTELAYVEVTSNVTVSGSEASPTDVVSAGALSFDGSTRICVEFFCPIAAPANVNNAKVATGLWDGVTELALMGQVAGGTSTSFTQAPILARRFLTPSNGSHTFSIKAWRGSDNGTLIFGTGVGGVGDFMPGYMRIVQA